MTPLDGTWARILEDGTLEMRDPNSGQNSDPAEKPRHQYRLGDHLGLLLCRVLPPESVGDRWADDDADDPWWEPVLELPPFGPVRDYWEERARGMLAHEYAFQARHAAGHVVAYTPNGREVRREGTELVVQPPNDNYWLTVPDLPAARRAFFRVG